MVVLFCQAAQIQGAEARSLPEEAGPPRLHLRPSRMPPEPQSGLHVAWGSWTDRLMFSAQTLDLTIPLLEARSPLTESCLNRKQTHPKAILAPCTDAQGSQHEGVALFEGQGRRHRSGDR